MISLAGGILALAVPLMQYAGGYAFASPGITAVSSDGRFAVAPVPGAPARTRIIDARTLREVHKLPGEALWSCAFAPGGDVVVCSGRGLHAFSSSTWGELWSTGFDGNYGALAFAPDGRTVYAGGMSARAEARDLRTGAVRWAQPHASITLALAVSPDGRWLAEGSDGGGLRVVDARTGALRATLADRDGTTAAARAGLLAHPGHVEHVAFSGRTLISAGGDGTIKAWDVERGRRTGRLECGARTSVIAGADGALYEGCGRRLRRVLANGTVRVLPIRGAPVAVTKDGRTLWTVGEPSYRFDVAHGTVEATYGDVVAGAFSRDGRRVAILRGDDDLTVSELAGARHIALRGFSTPPRGSMSHVVTRLKFDPTGTRLAAGVFTTTGFVDHSGVYKARLFLYDVAGGAVPRRRWDDVAVADMAFTPDARRIIVTSPSLTDTHSAIWRIATDGGVLETWRPDTDRPFYCAMGNGFGMAVPLAVRGGDDVAIPAGSCSRTPEQRDPSTAAAKLWNVPTRRATIVYQGAAGAPAVTFDANERISAAVDARQVLRVWDTASGALIARRTLDVPIRPEVEVGVAAGDEHVAVIVGPAPGFQAEGAGYDVTLYRARDLQPVARAHAAGRLRNLDVLRAGRVGVIMDDRAELWRLPG
ncbi:MAG TPA: PQQ-binding-like beta-propeller repeat protein [Candidatus Elarobacter sp.]|jgi:WD40 repeat protein